MLPPVVVPETGVVVLRSCHRGDASAAGAPGVIEVIDIHIVVVESRAAGSPHAPPHAARAEKAAERHTGELQMLQAARDVRDFVRAPLSHTGARTHTHARTQVYTANDEKAALRVRGSGGSQSNQRHSIFIFPVG